MGCAQSAPAKGAASVAGGASATSVSPAAGQQPARAAPEPGADDDDVAAHETAEPAEELGPADPPDQRSRSSSAGLKSTDETELAGLANSELSEIPSYVMQNAAPIKILWLDRNAFAEIPADIGAFCKLEKLNMYNNQLTHLPARVLPRTLRILELNHNKLTSIEDGTFSALPYVRHLDLCANLLTTEAFEAADLQAAKATLRFVDISSNRLRALPSALGALKLTELRVALNPLRAAGLITPLAHTHAAEIDLAACPFFIVACDGVWDALTDQEAVDAVLRLAPDYAHGAAALRDLAFLHGSTDNISAMVIDLTRLSSALDA